MMNNLLIATLVIKTDIKKIKPNYYSILSIMNIELENITQEDFDNYNFNNAKIITIKKSKKLEHIDGKNLPTSLVILKFESCKIRTIQSNALEHLYNLEELFIKDCYLESFCCKIPNNLGNIDLEYNMLININININNLERINLEYNKLENIPPCLLNQNITINVNHNNFDFGEREEFIPRMRRIVKEEAERKEEEKREDEREEEIEMKEEEEWGEEESWERKERRRKRREERDERRRKREEERRNNIIRNLVKIENINQDLRTNVHETYIQND